MAKLIFETVAFAILVTITGFIFELYGISRGWEWNLSGPEFMGLPLIIISAYFIGGLIVYPLSVLTYKLVQNRIIFVLLTVFYSVVSISIVTLFIMGGAWFWQGVIWYLFLGFALGMFLSRKCRKNALFCAINE